MNAWQLSSIRLLFVVILCEVWLHYVTQANEDSCRHLKFGTPFKGFALEGHVVKNLSIGIYASCKHLCLLENHCVLFNLGPPIKDRMVCELSDSDSTKHPEDLKPRDGFVHRGTENACSSNPCPHNGTCLNGFTDERYLCVCQAGYTGRQCEKDINECITGDHDCHLNGNCSNTAGSFNCTCQPGYIGDGRLCSENWKKINDVPVCFGARDETYGTFHIKESGLVYTFKLVHRSGSLSCTTDYPPSYWGCDHPNLEDKRLLTVITYPKKKALLLADYLRDVSGCRSRYYSYQIAGINVKSTELVFNKLPTPLSVSVGQEFHIWYGQDLTDCTEDNNAGQTCADVYAWYA
ncbi:uncharacterized protein LOC144658233 isoform X1 [Oculina patagonica]